MSIWLPVLLWTALGFFLGSIPFSVWLGRLTRQADMRSSGDGNPGAANAWRAGGWRIGLPVLVLDFLKAALPVGMAYQIAGVSGWSLVPVALAPVIGHAWSPFLSFRGGKAVNATFGVWCGLTLWEGPTLLGLLMLGFYAIQEDDAWSAILGLAALVAYLLLVHGDPVFLCIWAANLLTLVRTHWRDLRWPPRLRCWVGKSQGGLQ